MFTDVSEKHASSVSRVEGLRWDAPLKRRYASTRKYGVASKETMVFIVTAARIPASIADSLTNIRNM
jgi:hypothetical protein